MSFNVRGNFPEKYEARLWDTRADLNVRTIRKYQPDIIGFQEVQPQNSAVYTQQLTAYDRAFGWEGDADVDTEEDTRWVFYNPIYWRRDRFELVESGGFFLSDTPDVWSKGWDAAFVRGANWVRLRSLQSGAEVVHLNAHLDHIGETARIEGSKLIVQRLNAVNPGLPSIVTADFNSRAWQPPDEDKIKYPSVVRRDALPPGGTVHQVYMDADFRDTYDEAGHYNQLNMNTFHAFMGEEFPSCGLRIDWVLIRDGAELQIETESFNILRDGEPPVFPSDHYPVMAEVALR